MEWALYILMLSGGLGAYDVIYYHMYTCRLYQKPECAAENVTHIIRAVLFCVWFLVILHVRATGMWWWLYVGIVAVETINTFVDIVLEGTSRTAMGGLPHGEYILHAVLSLLTGAMMTCVIVFTLPWLHEPTSLTFYTLDVPFAFQITTYLSVLGGLGFFAFETVSLLKLRFRRPEATA